MGDQNQQRIAERTGNAGEQLTSEALDLAVRKRHKAIALQKVKDALAKEVHNDADVAAIVEAVSQMDTAIPVLLVICFERR